MLLDQTYKQLIEKDTPDYPARDILYDFAHTYHKYMEIQHDFADGEKLTSVEAHTLKHICQNNGVTLSDIVSYWGRTKGTVSSQIKQLEEKGYVYREKCRVNSKKIHIFPTEKGLQANQKHIEYDISESTAWLEKWLTKYTIEDMNLLMEQLEFYTEYLKSKTK